MIRDKQIPDGCLLKNMQFFESVLNTGPAQFRKCSHLVTSKISTKSTLPGEVEGTSVSGMLWYFSISWYTKTKWILQHACLKTYLIVSKSFQWSCSLDTQLIHLITQFWHVTLWHEVIWHCILTNTVKKKQLNGALIIYSQQIYWLDN